MMTFLQEICNFLYFIHENMGTDFSTWSMKSVFYVWKSSCICLECCMFHIWIYVHIFSCMNKEFCIIHIGKFEHTFSCWIMELYFHKWISQLNFLTRDMQFSIVQIWHSRSKYAFHKYKMCTFHKWKSR